VHTFRVYRFSPLHLRGEVHLRLAYSVKKLIEALPDEQFEVFAPEAETAFLRLLRDADACDFILHHHLVLSLLADDFQQARRILGFLALRSPRTAGQVLDFSSEQLGEDLDWYAAAYALNDLPDGSLQLVAPTDEASAITRQLIHESLAILRSASAEVVAEIEAIKPLWILASTSEMSTRSFGGYSSSIAWGSIAINSNRHDLVGILIQVIHELAHQLLFALSLEIPLVFNHPEELYPSPLRRDPRPMDGVLHACFVSARVHEVLRQIVSAPCYGALTPSDQDAIMAAIADTAEVVRAALPTIEQSARLSGVGERVVTASRRAVTP